MSEENVQTFRRMVDAFNEGDMKTLESVLTQESEWDWSRSIGPDKAVYRGPQAITRFWHEFVAGFEDIRITIEDVIDEGDRLIATILSVMRGRGGIEVEARNAFLITLRDGKLARLEMFQTKREALEAAGLLE